MKTMTQCPLDYEDKCESFVMVEVWRDESVQGTPRWNVVYNDDHLMAHLEKCHRHLFNEGEN